MARLDDTGPFIVDNNILLSPYSIRTQSQGGAYIHNLIAGAVYTWPEPNRFTPYFLPHSTDMAGLTTILAGDDRFYNNIFVGKGSNAGTNAKLKFGTEGYNGTKLQVSMSGNVYYFGAKPCESDKNFIESSGFDPELKLTEEGNNAYLNLSLSNEFAGHNNKLVTSDLLGNAKIPKSRFENADGTSIILNKDFFGHLRSEENTTAGPFSNVGNGKLVLKVW